jgi:hypothetical protein
VEAEGSRSQSRGGSICDEERGAILKVYRTCFAKGKGSFGGSPLTNKGRISHGLKREVSGSSAMQLRILPALSNSPHQKTRLGAAPEDFSHCLILRHRCTPPPASPCRAPPPASESAFCCCGVSTPPCPHHIPLPRPILQEKVPPRRAQKLPDARLNVQAGLRGVILHHSATLTHHQIECPVHATPLDGAGDVVSTLVLPLNVAPQKAENVAGHSISIFEIGTPCAGRMGESQDEALKAQEEMWIRRIKASSALVLDEYIMFVFPPIQLCLCCCCTPPCSLGFTIPVPEPPLHRNDAQTRECLAKSHSAQ